MESFRKVIQRNLKVIRVFIFQVRFISYKLDEIYGMIERLFFGIRKIELFGRFYNV